MLKHYQNQACPEAAELMREEAITYSVLINILQGECTDIFTDSENMVVCYSASPWPVWVWCRDVEDASVVGEIARCIREKLPLEQVRACIMSEELLEKLKETDAYFRSAERKMGLLSYRLDAICDVHYPCDGSMRLVREDEITALTDVRHDMSMEMEGMDLSRERCEESLRTVVSRKGLFAWCNGAGEIVALTSRGDQPPYSKIAMVYTLPGHRRKGYAINLVHAVTETILTDGLTPILYTDEGYAASNACYQKIGYRQVGCLTSICGKKA